MNRESYLGILLVLGIVISFLFSPVTVIAVIETFETDLNVPSKPSDAEYSFETYNMTVQSDFEAIKVEYTIRSDGGIGERFNLGFCTLNMYEYIVDNWAMIPLWYDDLVDNIPSSLLSTSLDGGEAGEYVFYVKTYTQTVIDISVKIALGSTTEIIPIESTPIDVLTLLGGFFVLLLVHRKWRGKRVS